MIVKINYASHTEDSINNGECSDYGIVYITAPSSAPHHDTIKHIGDDYIGKPDEDFYRIDCDVHELQEYIRQLPVNNIYYTTYKCGESLCIEAIPDIDQNTGEKTLYSITLVQYTRQELTDLKQAIRA